MNPHVEDQLVWLALGELPETSGVAEHLARCSSCSDAQRALHEALHALPQALPTLPPAATLRARLLCAVDDGAAAASEPTLLQRLARLFDLALDEAQRIYDAVTDPAVWVAPLPGVRLMHLQGGPATAGADCGLVHIAAGQRFPRHRHRGLETTIVLRGSYRDGEQVFRAGHPDPILCAGGSEHDMEALEDLLYAVTVLHGVEILEGDIQVTG